MIAQDDAVGMASLTSGAGALQAPALAKLYRRSGVSTRHCVILESSTNGAPARQTFFAPATPAQWRGPTTAARMRVYESDAAELATRAARSALEEAGIEGREVTHLVTASCTGFHAPGVDLSLCEKLSLPADVSRTHIGFMGCHAALNALRVANALAAADPAGCVMVCAVELCSLHFQYSDRSDQIVSNALFADGAAAIVGRGTRRGESWGGVTAFKSLRLPATSELMSWRVGDFGFEMSLSSRVPGVIRRHLRPWISMWLAEQGLGVDDVDAWAVHPGGPRILDACAESLGLSEAAMEPSRAVLARCGNMSSPTILFVLDEIRRTGSGRRCVMLAFGPGLAIEMALLEFEVGRGR
jgi:predicted naringenin-chalcone synthase